MNKQRNIYLVYIYTFLSTFVLFYACDTLFYLERGISSSQYIFFVVIAFLVQIILEIPAGILADKYSKKKILIVGNLLFLISILLFITSYNFYMFILATIIKSINNALVTGITNSILYESIKDKSRFKKVLFSKNFFLNISYMITVVLGGYIGLKLGLVYSYYLTLIPVILNFLVIFSIKEEKTEKITLEKTTYISIFKNAIKEIKATPILINIILSSSIIFSIIRLVEESHPQYANEIGINVFDIGIYVSIILVLCIVGGYIGSRLKEKYVKTALFVNVIFVGVCILMLGALNNYVGIMFLLVIYIFSESFDNIMLNRIHNGISSKSRVTVESIISMMCSLFGVAFGLIMSICLNYIELHQMYMVFGIIITSYGVFNFIFNFKKVKI